MEMTYTITHTQVEFIKRGLQELYRRADSFDSHHFYDPAIDALQEVLEAGPKPVQLVRLDTPDGQPFYINAAEVSSVERVSQSSTPCRVRMQNGEMHEANETVQAVGRQVKIALEHLRAKEAPANK